MWTSVSSCHYICSCVQFLCALAFSSEHKNWTLQCTLKALTKPTEINVHIIDSQENRLVKSEAKLACAVELFPVGWIRKECYETY
jgi:hypothetical protein